MLQPQPQAPASYTNRRHQQFPPPQAPCKPLGKYRYYRKQSYHSYHWKKERRGKNEVRQREQSMPIQSISEIRAYKRYMSDWMAPPPDRMNLHPSKEPIAGGAGYQGDIPPARHVRPQVITEEEKRWGYTLLAGYPNRIISLPETGWSGPDPPLVPHCRACK